MTLTGTIWSPVGPSPMGQGGRQDNGLTSAIAVNPNNPDVIYQGTAGGGVWRSRDGGDSWTPIFDRQLSLGIGEPGAIAIDPTDTSIIYVGTSTRLTPQAQAGLFRSDDGGASCIRLGSGYPAGNVGNASQFFTQAINEIVVDPTTPTTLYMATATGVYRSTDRGLNWTFGVGSGGDARSLVLDRTSPTGARILYAGVTGIGILRSVDSGVSWAPILNAATPAVTAAIGGTPGAGFSKAIVALAPPTAPPNAAGIQVLYATLSGQGGAPDPVGLFLSTDQGATWARRTATGMPAGTQGGYSFHMAVDPASPGDGVNDIVYVGCVGQGRSGNSGGTFASLNGMHPDTHAWAFVPQPAPAPSIVYCGNDGGLFRSTDNGATWVPRNAGGIQTGLFYNLAAKPDLGGTALLGSLQDNGNQTTAGAVSPGWDSPQGGDGWDVAFDGGTPGRAYGTSGFWSPAPCTRVWRSDDDGASWPTEVTPWGTTSDAGCYLSPIACDPSAAGIVYVSGNQNLWQSRNGGNNWRNLGPFPGNMAVAPSNGNYVAVANGNRVFVSSNALAATVGGPGGVTFTDITRNLPSRSVLRAKFDPVDPTVVYAVLGGFDGAGPGQRGHVFRTTVSATAWENISPPLDVPFGGLALDGADTPTTIYAGSDFGVLRSVDEGRSWTILDDIHFPRAPVTDLVLSDGGVLRAATYGRGVFEFAVPGGPAIAVNLDDGLDFGTVCEGRHFRTLQVFNVGVEPLVIASVQRLMGSTGFSVLTAPGTPIRLAPGEEIDFEVEFSPTAPGAAEMATIRIVSNDAGAPVVDLLATGRGGRPAIVLAIADSGLFGDVCLDEFVDRELTIANRGPCTLRVDRITSSDPQFIPPGVAAYPIMVAAGGSVSLPVRFEPSAQGPAAATLTVTSNDPGGARVVAVRGNAPPPRLVVSIANQGSFGEVCVCDYRDEMLTLSNGGRCPLTVSAITSSDPQFVVPMVDALPLVIGAGDAVEVMVRFEPSSFGPKAATLTFVSDDPSSPATLGVSGYAPSGHLVVTGTGHFGPVDFGRRAEREITIHNTGRCDLHVQAVGFLPDPWRPGCRDCDHCDCGSHCSCGGPSHGATQVEPQEGTPSDVHEGKLHDGGGLCRCCGPFQIISNPFPATVRPGTSLPLMIRFVATCAGPACCELVIMTDDPDAESTTVYVTGSLHRTLRSALKCWAADEIQTLLRAGTRPC